MFQEGDEDLRGVDYDAVNAAVNDYFFRGRFEMVPVYLDLEGEAETELAEDLGIEAGELGSFVGLSAARSLRFDKANPYVDHIQALKEWSQAGRREPPPFTALLCALSIAAEHMGADENFSHNNYYQRLFELLRVEDSTSHQKLKQFAKSTRQLWRALNLWLSENDFMLGRPTARPLVSHWKYASYALSQALLRDADRKRFESLFELYDLAPGDAIPEAEMTLLVNEWMSSQGSSGPTSWLRKLWSANELRERIVASALGEFESWQGVGDRSAHGSGKARLLWQLGFSGFPRKRANLSLVTRGGQSEDLKADQPADDTLEGLRLDPSGEPSLCFLAPTESIILDLWLLQSRQFTGLESGMAYNYVAKPIVAFARSPEGPSYREVSRVSLFEDHAILCHEAWLERVEAHLSQCSRREHTVLQPSDMSGIPNGWCIVRDVEIVRSVDNVHDNLHALNPIAGEAVIACVDGLKLGHGSWHLDATPTVEATSEKPDCKLEILKEQFGEKDELLASSQASGDFMEANLEEAGITAGANLRAVVKTKTTELTEFSFSLRSAAMPRPLSRGRIFHPVVEGAGFSLEEGLVESDSITGLEGCLVHGDLRRRDVAEPRGDVTDPSAVPKGSLELPMETNWQRSENAALEATETCVIRGYHHWVYEPFEKGDDRFDAKMAECKNCHVRTLSRSRKQARSNWRRTREQDLPVPRRKSANLVSHGHPEPDGKGDAILSVDTIFDGLCYLGQGTWGAFQRIVSGASEDPWFSQSFASDLFALGSLEMRDAFHSVTSNWSVPPPVIVINHEHTGFLAGFHSKALVKNIAEVFGEAGAEYEPISVSGQVTLHKWSDLTNLDIEAVLKVIEDPHGRPVTAARGLAGLVANHLAPVHMAWERGTPMHIEKHDGLAKFDVNKANWMRTDSMQSPGAYRVGLYGTQYVYRDQIGATRKVGHRVAKILAARAEGKRLHSYDRNSREFSATLGAEPPGLYARALVASSGSLPRKEDGLLFYENVEPSVAEVVLSKMYEGG